MALPLWAGEVADTTDLRLRELNEVSVTGHADEDLAVSGYRLVATMTQDDIRILPVTTVADLLQYIPGVDIRQRGASGVQADLSIRGGTGKQAKVFLNGIDMTDPQTEHYTMNLPIDALLIERIEVLQGTNYALDAFSGAINIVTKGGKELVNDGVSELASRGVTLQGKLTAGEYGLVHPALAVKVRARIFSGCTPLMMRYWIRLVSTEVLPEPAPARIRRAPFCLWSCKTAIRWSPFRPFKMLSASIGYRCGMRRPEICACGIWKRD